MVNEAYIWAIFLLPLASFGVIAFIIRPFLNRHYALSGLVLILPLAVALGLSFWTLRAVILGEDLNFAPHQWLEVGSATIEMGLLVDQLTAIMLIVVTGVSLMVQVYSLGYMREDPGHARYFAYMALFTSAMLGLVLAVNIIQLYVFWELVGVSSYLLIGFWHERPAAAAAAKKAFIITRIGDVGFLIAILYLFLQADQFALENLNAFHIPDIWQAAQPLAAGGAILGGTALTWFALGIFAGAAGKSGQFPLHSWLPDAMEGPTPVSALIHAATMVAAGVFLVARFYPVFQSSENALTVVALVGAFTALMAATMALVMNDIKRVMAYSTISQLGYMMAALGVGAYGAAVFHLLTHASFKALLFMGAGSVNHATGTFDMRYMGGLWRRMPLTYLMTLVAGLSLVGIIPLAGFWSKDEILVGAWNGSALVDDWVSRLTFAMLLVGVVLTAFYTFRMLYMTFHGQFRGGIERELEEQAQAAPGQIQTTPDQAGQTGGVHLAESPFVMVLPMFVLALAAIFSGYLVNPQWVEELGIPKHWVTEFLLEGLAAALPAVEHLEAADFNRWLAAVSTGVALAGLALGMLLYWRRGTESQEPRRDPLEATGPLHTLLSRKYYVDTLYEDAVVRRIFYRSIVAGLDWLDRNLVDGTVDAVGWIFRNIGSVIGRLQTGQVQAYATVIALGSILILLGFLLS
ncbi:MAG: NADH-quinone oxidoreductase subunit L [SAR202 cluster bacterium Io17-Chloro-G9]|nr:MAG: NADH-quinone oxidoreductase subunit L [SAR202 cluster bacterium Io17-Chloro-G9]